MNSKMTMLDWDPRQRSLVADKLFDAGNIAAGGMLFGQFVADRPFSVALGIIGLSIWIICLFTSVALERRSRP
jgi:hypothetical protein